MRSPDKKKAEDKKVVDTMSESSIDDHGESSKEPISLDLIVYMVFEEGIKNIEKAVPHFAK